MRIAFDAKRAFLNATGLGQYSRTLIRDLAAQAPAHEWLLYTPQKSETPFSRWAAATPQVQVQTPLAHALPGVGSLWRTLGVGTRLRIDEANVFHGLSAELPIAPPVGKRVPMVVTIHDLIFLRYPDLYRSHDRVTYTRKLTYACRQAQHVVCISEATRDDLLNYLSPTLPDLAARTEVIYQACDARFRTPVAPQAVADIRQHYGLPERFLLYVGSLEGRKNIPVLLEALQHWPANDPVALVVAGKGKDAGALRARAAHLPAHVRVQWLGYVPDEALPALYTAATALTYPSIYEGFGIPIQEALHMGIPVVTSDSSCFRETGGNVALYCPPEEPEAWRETLRQVWQHTPGESWQQARKVHMHHFAPEKLCARWLEVYAMLAQAR